MTFDLVYNIMREMCIEYECILCLTDCCENSGAYISPNNIHIGEFVNCENMLVAFFHELGHHQSNKLFKRKTHFSKLSDEGMAWEIGFSIAYNLGFIWEYNSAPMKWARDQYKSYFNSEYNDLL